jgi:hypothetical protein
MMQKWLTILLKEKKGRERAFCPFVLLSAPDAGDQQLLRRLELRHLDL